MEPFITLQCRGMQSRVSCRVSNSFPFSLKNALSVTSHSSAAGGTWHHSANKRWQRAASIYRRKRYGHHIHQLSSFHYPYHTQCHKIVRVSVRVPATLSHSRLLHQVFQKSGPRTETCDGFVVALILRCLVSISYSRQSSPSIHQKVLCNVKAIFQCLEQSHRLVELKVFLILSFTGSPTRQQW